MLVGSATWITDAAWGWSATGWMVKYLGYHDAYASGVVHAIAGGIGAGRAHRPRASYRQVPR